MPTSHEDTQSIRKAARDTSFGLYGADELAIDERNIVPPTKQTVGELNKIRKFNTSKN